MKKLMKRKTALIIGIILVILIFGVFFWYFQNKYQKYYEDVPELVAISEDGTETPTLCYQYNWTYRDNVNEQLSGIASIANYEFPDEYITFGKATDIWSDVHFINIKNNIQHSRTTELSYIIYKITSEGVTSVGSGGSYNDDINELLYSGEYALTTLQNIGEYVYDIYIQYKNQGDANYAFKVINFKQDVANAAKPYMNTSLNDENTIKELVSKLEYAEYLKDISIEGTTLNLTYEYYILESSTKMNNLCLFACIPELEKITYTGENANTYGIDEETGETVLTEETKVEFTREEVNSEDAANTENLIKYMENL